MSAPEPGPASKQLKLRPAPVARVDSAPPCLDANAGKTPPHSFFSRSGAGVKFFRSMALPAGWTGFEDSCLYRAFGEVASSSPRVVGFDFDGTLVARASEDGLAFPTVRNVLRRLAAAGDARLVIFTNESVDHLAKSPQSVQSTLLRKLARVQKFCQELQVPVEVFIATRKDAYRKPCSKEEAKDQMGGIKMWTKMTELSKTPVQLDLCEYVGDAADHARHFSDADKLFAERVGVRFSEAQEFFAKVMVPASAAAEAAAAPTDAACTPTDAACTGLPLIPAYHPPDLKPNSVAGGGGFRSVLRAYMAPGCASPFLWFRHQHAVVVYDAYPKADRHVLVIPTDLPDVNAVAELRPAHLGRVLQAHELARHVADAFRGDTAVDVQVGYHARPSLDCLHIHVMTRTMANMTTIKHWNSFASPELFVPIDRVEFDLKQGRAVSLPPREELDALEKAVPRCFVCGFAPARSKNSLAAMVRELMAHSCAPPCP